MSSAPAARARAPRRCSRGVLWSTARKGSGVRASGISDAAVSTVRSRADRAGFPAPGGGQVAVIPGTASVGARAAEHRRDRPQDDREVAPDAPRPDVAMLEL